MPTTSRTVEEAREVLKVPSVELFGAGPVAT